LKYRYIIFVHCNETFLFNLYNLITRFWNIYVVDYIVMVIRYSTILQLHRGGQSFWWRPEHPLTSFTTWAVIKLTHIFSGDRHRLHLAFIRSRPWRSLKTNGECSKTCNIFW
jgi:hypothetical protein